MHLYLNVKRSLDIILSLIALLTLSPFLLLIAALIMVDSPGPVFFKQRRVGKGKKEFLIYKFRTMRIDTPRDTPTHLLSNPDKYITRIGKILRRTSLDELPQIINILKGEMSCVGPRPALWNQKDLITERDRLKANSILPGLTGWAQVNGRDELPIPIKAAYDGEYVGKMSLLFDLKIFLLTVLRVIRSEGILEGAACNDKPVLSHSSHPVSNEIVKNI